MNSLVNLENKNLKSFVDNVYIYHKIIILLSEKTKVAEFYGIFAHLVHTFKMFLRTYIDDDGKRVYTLKVRYFK